MRYCIDIDGTICTPGTCRECQYEGATPKKDRIKVINKLYDEGNYIMECQRKIGMMRWLYLTMIRDM